MATGNVSNRGKDYEAKLKSIGEEYKLGLEILDANYRIGEEMAKEKEAHERGWRPEDMVWGHYIIDTGGNKRFIAEDCSYCQLSTGGQHEPKCPLLSYLCADKGSRLWEIREDSHRRYGEAWRKLAQM